MTIKPPMPDKTDEMMEQTFIKITQYATLPQANPENGLKGYYHWWEATFGDDFVGSVYEPIRDTPRAIGRYYVMDRYVAVVTKTAWEALRVFREWQEKGLPEQYLTDLEFRNALDKR